MAVEDHYHIFHPERVANPETINGSATLLVVLVSLRRSSVRTMPCVTNSCEPTCCRVCV